MHAYKYTKCFLAFLRMHILSIRFLVDVPKSEQLMKKIIVGIATEHAFNTDFLLNALL